MAYCIFVKSPRILETFRKNRHIKILPKSPCANFQSLDKISKILFYSERFSSWPFNPVGPAGPGRCPFFLAEPGRAPLPPQAHLHATPAHHPPPLHGEPTNGRPTSMPLLKSDAPPPPRLVLAGF
jgi:hypothetical protein